VVLLSPICQEVAATVHGKGKKTRGAMTASFEKVKWLKMNGDRNKAVKKGHPPLRVGVGPEMLSPGGYE
jgi:hypothetical protein